MTVQGEQSTSGIPVADRTIDREAAPAQRRAGGVLAAGSVVTALVATSCCVLPFALFTAGITGAWMGHLRALEPYQPYFLGLALACLAGGFYAVYGKPKAEACEGGYCARPASRRIAKAGLWLSSTIVLLVIAWPRLLPLFIGEQLTIN